MLQTQFTNKLRTLRARMAVLRAQETELLHRMEQAAKEPIKKRMVAKKPAKKKVIPTSLAKGIK